MAHGNNSFLKYNAKVFSWEDQVQVRFFHGTLHGRLVDALVPSLPSGLTRGSP